jgi:hypothetical protein
MSSLQVLRLKCCMHSYIPYFLHISHLFWFNHTKYLVKSKIYGTDCAVFYSLLFLPPSQGSHHIILISFFLCPNGKKVPKLVDRASNHPITNLRASTNI